MRKLASIQKILDIQPIVGADAIEVATINSWKVVVKKNEFKIGDLVIYLEVDSWVPHELAPFLTKGDAAPREYDGVKGERLRTVKLRGQLSQGLVLPTSFVTGEDISAYELSEGQDVTEALGVLKYDPPIPAQLAGVVKGPWPSSVPKTDEERIQNLTNEWGYLSRMSYEVTEKLEGSSMTVARINDEFLVCSRNLNLTETEGNTLWALARKYDIETKMISENLNNLAIQGECIGEGVEDNHYNIKGQDFYVYSIYNIVIGEYLIPTDRKTLCEKLGLKHVPIIEFIEGTDLYGTSIDQLLMISNGKSQINPSKLREGLVYKQVTSQAHWKAVSNEYLLKHK